MAVRGVHDGVVAVADSPLFHDGRHGALDETEQVWAKVAWGYFARNTGSVGLVGNVAGFPVASMWTTGDYLVALLAAQRFGLVERQEFDRRLSQVLNFLAWMPLAYDRLPSRLYRTDSGATTNFAGEPGELGWSAVDTGRLLVALRLVCGAVPLFAEYVDRVVGRLSLCDALQADGTLRSVHTVDGQPRLGNETSRGCDAYAAAGYALWGLSPMVPIEPEAAMVVTAAGQPFPQVEWTERDRLGPIVTAPVTLAGMEFGWKVPGVSPVEQNRWRSLAERVYAAQVARHKQEGILTARNDYHRSSAPYLVYDTVVATGYPWNTYDDAGTFRPELALVSTRAAFGLWALWRTGYTDRLIQAVGQLYEPDAGWREGRLEQSGGYEWTVSAATNTMVLEALLYKAEGPLYEAFAGQPAAPPASCARLVVA